MTSQEEYDLAFQSACRSVQQQYPNFCDATTHLLAHAIVWGYEHGVTVPGMTALGALINALYETHAADDDHDDDEIFSH